MRNFFAIALSALLSSLSLMVVTLISPSVFGYDVAQGPSNNWAKFSRGTPGVSESIGGYSGGCLTGGVDMRATGSGYAMMRVKRHRFFTHAKLRDFLTRLAGESLDNALFFGDLAQPRGGPSNGSHVSHQNGLDADVWFQRRLDYPAELPVNWPEQLSASSVVDLEKMILKSNWPVDIEPLLIWVAKQQEVDRFFVHPVIKKHFCVKYPDLAQTLKKMRPWYGHDDHFHVRLKCAAGDRDCITQSPIPGDDDCGKDLDRWFSTGAKEPLDASLNKVFQLPERCRLIETPAE